MPKKLQKAWKKLKQIFVIKTPICKICCVPIKDTNLHMFIYKKVSICSNCFYDLNPKFIKHKVDGVPALSLFEYDTKIQELIYRYKACNDYELKDIFLDYFRAHLRIKFWGYILVPAPSHKSMVEKRGFEHVEEIYKCLHLKIVKIINKKSDRKQSDLTSKERQEIEKFFEPIPHESLLHKKVLIIDDVFTTGSTVRALIHFVKKDKPKIIKILTIAKTMDLNDERRALQG